MILKGNRKKSSKRSKERQQKKTIFLDSYFKTKNKSDLYKENFNTRKVKAGALFSD